MGETPDLFLSNRIQQSLSHLGLGYIIVTGTGSSISKESACGAGDLGSISESGRSPGEGNHYPLQYSCLENSMDREAWQAIIHGVTKSWTQLSNIIAIQQWGPDVTPGIQITHTHMNMYKVRQRGPCDEQLQMGSSC